MPRKSKKPVRKQTTRLRAQVGQILLPMIAHRPKADLTEWVREQGLTALRTAQRGRRGGRGTEGQAREEANS